MTSWPLTPSHRKHPHDQGPGGGGRSPGTPVFPGAWSKRAREVEPSRVRGPVISAPVLSGSGWVGRPVVTISDDHISASASVGGVHGAGSAWWRCGAPASARSRLPLPPGFPGGLFAAYLCASPGDAAAPAPGRRLGTEAWRVEAGCTSPVRQLGGRIPAAGICEGLRHPHPVLFKEQTKATKTQRGDRAQEREDIPLFVQRPCTLVLPWALQL